jgi:hypothetical protein
MSIVDLEKIGLVDTLLEHIRRGGALLPSERQSLQMMQYDLWAIMGQIEVRCEVMGLLREDTADTREAEQRGQSELLAALQEKLTY